MIKRNRTLLKLVRFFGFLLLATSWLEASELTSRFSTYVGTITSDTQRQQFVRFDFVPYRDHHNKFQLKAIITFFNGGFDDGKSTGITFDEVDYNILNGTLRFGSGPAGVAISVDDFAEGHLSGWMTLGSNNYRGRFDTMKGYSVSDFDAVQQTLEGHYQGVCFGKDAELTISSHRSASIASDLAGFASALSFDAELAVHDAKLCSSGLADDETSAACVVGRYRNGIYQPSTGTLTMIGEPEPLHCKVTYAQIRCSERCVFNGPKTIVAGQNESLMPKMAFAKKDMPQSNDPLVPGTFNGYLYHDRLDLYQALSLQVKRLPASSSSNGNAFAVEASLCFGKADKDVCLRYSFPEVQRPPLFKNATWLATADDRDIMIHTKIATKNALSGTWYSRSRGRIGQFLIRTEGLVTLPDRAVIMVNPSGVFASTDTELVLSTQQVSAPSGTSNPFLPFHLVGYFKIVAGINKRIAITHSSYDFYTGKIALMLYDGSERTVTGTIARESGNLNLRWKSACLGCRIPATAKSNMIFRKRYP